MSQEIATGGRWYDGITRYQWLVLLIASLGWIFDVFEGQIFVASMKDAMPALVDPGEQLPEWFTSALELPADPDKRKERLVAVYNQFALASFLLGGALGGIFFGMLSDRIGRTRTMIITILMYSCFTCVTAFAQAWWHMVALRFLVAMGVGGEWAVASAMVAEVFPSRARAWSLGIFHASSVLGTYMAVAAGAFVVGNPHLVERGLGWRVGFAIGAIPAVLTLWIRWKLREPDKWVQAREAAKQDDSKKTGRLADIFAPGLLRKTVVGVALATIGLATFWGVHIHGRSLYSQAAENQYLAELPDDADDAARKAVLADNSQAIKYAEMLGMFIVTTGGGIGLVCFGPICERIGRRGAFAIYHLGSFASTLILFQLLATAPIPVLWVALPIFGFFTVGMHAGYAIYFPELYPTRLRGTGAGFCFNGGRILASPILLFVVGWMLGKGLSLENTVSILGSLFLVGAVVSMLGPETKGQELPE